MNYEALLNKFASEELTLNPALQNVMHRVQAQGLHKAASVYGLDTVDLRSVITKIGTDMYREQLKHASITSGLCALNALVDSGDLKLASVASRLVGGADDAARMLGDDAAAAAGRFNPKATITGGTPGIGQLPTHPKSMAGAAGKATPPPVPGSMPAGPSIEGVAAARGNPGMPTPAEMSQMAAKSPPPIPAAARNPAGAADDLWAAPKGPSPFSGQGAAPARPGRAALPEGAPNPGLDTLVNGLGTREKAQLGRAFGVGAEEVTPAMYMRAAHGVR